MEAAFRHGELEVLIFCFYAKSCVFLEYTVAYLGAGLALFFFPPIDVCRQALAAAGGDAGLCRALGPAAAPPAPGAFMALGPVAPGCQVLAREGARAPASP